MIAETISLGILALPHAAAALGFFPGLFFIALFGLVATYAGYVIGMFKLRYPSVRNPGDVGGFLFVSFVVRAYSFSSSSPLESAIMLDFS